MHVYACMMIDEFCFVIRTLVIQIIPNKNCRVKLL